MKHIKLAVTLLLILFLSACGSNSTKKAVVISPTITEFVALSTPITVGQSTTLSWKIEGTQPINMSISSIGNIEGTNVSVSPTITTTYTLTVTNSAGTVTKDLTITVNPVLTQPIEPEVIAPTIKIFKASSTSITVGQSATLDWTVEGTKPINISITGLGNRTGSSVSVSPTSTTTYTLIAANSAGKATEDLIITVKPAPPPVEPTTPVTMHEGSYEGNAVISNESGDSFITEITATLVRHAPTTNDIHIGYSGSMKIEDKPNEVINLLCTSPRNNFRRLECKGTSSENKSYLVSGDKSTSRSVLDGTTIKYWTGFINFESDNLSGPFTLEW